MSHEFGCTKLEGIHRGPVLAHLKVQVRARHLSRGSNPADWFSTLHALPLGDEDGGKVGIDGGHLSTVVDDHNLSVSYRQRDGKLESTRR